METKERTEPSPHLDEALLVNTEDAFATDVPVIDLLQTDHETVVRQIADACGTAGFFQVLHHGIPEDLIAQFRSQCRAYFTELDPSVRESYRRNEHNARGFFDDELTKQRRDWKMALDVGMPASRDWTVPDDAPANRGCLDGYNRFPTEEELPGFRATVMAYFAACAALAHRLTVLMTEGLQLALATEHPSGSADEAAHEPLDDMAAELQQHHTSYLRMNYYPPCPEDVAQTTDPPPLGISPHRDAGFLTILLQDDDCYSLQVPRDPNDHAEWRTVVPLPGALTINTGDMAQIWSNGRYRAPLHRVRTHGHHERFSAPFFYNPGYRTWIRPVVRPSSIQSADEDANTSTAVARYHPCLWGYFRAVRFAGDLTNLGVEIQVEDFLTDHACSPHLARQAWFAEQAVLEEPFSVERFRQFLMEEEDAASASE